MLGAIACEVEIDALVSKNSKLTDYRKMWVKHVPLLFNVFFGSSVRAVRVVGGEGGIGG